MDLKQLIDTGFANLALIEEKFALYQKNPASLDSQWRTLFEQLKAEESSSPLPRIGTLKIPEFPEHPTLPLGEGRGHSVLYYPKIELPSTDSGFRICKLIDAYRRYGYLSVNTSPIIPHSPSEPHQLKLENLGFSKQDLSALYPVCGLLPVETAPLLEMINVLKSIYCNKIGIEYMHTHNRELEEWLQQQIEPNNFRLSLTIDQKRLILQHLNKSELFESFLHTKYVGQKRFSLEGGETLIPMLAMAIDLGATLGVDEYVIGMAHRGRLNVLCNILDKSYADIFSEFEESYIPDSVEGSGDVKYHKGFYSEIKTVQGHQVKLTLTPNPSHLESVNPVVEGQVRARQVMRNDKAKEKVIPILIHGDAAISGQGVVYETMQFCRLAGYSTGGTIHFVINNQIGFTTLPKDSRSTRYCTDIARIFEAPIFHVNAEDPEGCVYATILAMELRQRFHCDVFIELDCYRKYGHNETDEPAFTQPLEYKIIRRKHPIRELYRDSLIQQGVLEKNVALSLEVEFKEALHQALQLKRGAIKGPGSGKETPSSGSLFKDREIFEPFPTGVPRDHLKVLGEQFCHIPEGFNLHPKLVVLNQERLSMLKPQGTRPIDWGMGELLAYASLLWDGLSIRLSGQDSGRGTFSHRHALLVDQEKEQEYIPLQHLKPEQGRFDLYNSPLSEYAALGFEYGYSLESSNSLVIWEAQFGDFSNGAQIIIDQYISTAEQKWMQKFNLTLFLPHGYEGQGPEHSSGRMERFLILAGDNNLQIVNPTTPAQFFHLLRRQALRPLRKPLIVFTPKGLLRHPSCVSHLEELTQGAFQEILEDPSPPERTRRLVFCSGRIFYDLIAEREKSGTDHMTIIRVEQLYPLHIEKLKEIIQRHAGLKECLWVQEEPNNMGAWNYLHEVLQSLMPKGVEIRYVGRVRSASPAAGSHAVHKKEHAAILHDLFYDRGSSFNGARHLKA